MRGGKRPGAGRPLGSAKPEAKPRAIRMTDVEYVKYVEFGGARWVKRLLNEAIDLAIEQTKGK